MGPSVSSLPPLPTPPRVCSTAVARRRPFLSETPRWAKFTSWHTSTLPLLNHYCHQRHRLPTVAQNGSHSDRRHRNLCNGSTAHYTSHRRHTCPAYTRTSHTLFAEIPAHGHFSFSQQWHRSFENQSSKRLKYFAESAAGGHPWAPSPSAYTSAYMSIHT